MRSQHRSVRLAFIGLAFVLATASAVGAPLPPSKSLAVPSVSQQPQTNWCWAAVSQAILSYTGNAPGMCTIANFGRTNNGWGADDCCTNGTGAICNQPNAMYGSAGSLQNILQSYGASSARYARSLNVIETKEAIADDSPLVVRWGWTNGGGHFVSLHGYSGSDMTIMDPWSGPTILSHANVTSTPQRSWTHTLVVTPKKITYVVDDTGSMGDEIASVRTSLIQHVNQLRNEKRFTKFTLITYKDDVTVRGTTVVPSEITSWINALTASGGGDCPEEGYGALDKAAEIAPKS